MHLAFFHAFWWNWTHRATPLVLWICAFHCRNMYIQSPFSANGRNTVWLFFLSLFTGVGHHLDIFVLNNDFISCVDCSRCLLVCFIVNIYILLGISSFQLHRVRQCAIWRQLFGNVSIFEFLFNSPSLSAFFNVLAFPFNVYFKNVAFFTITTRKSFLPSLPKLSFFDFLFV